MSHLIPRHSRQDYSYNSYSHQDHLIKEIYESCNFSHSDMNLCRFRDKAFIKCDFRHADISSSEFEDCDFINCKFEYTNLTNSIFSGCHFIDREDSTCVDAGIRKCSTSNITIEASSNRRSMLDSVVLKDLGLRESSFNGVDFISIDLSSISLESSKLVNCTFDSLRLTSNNVKGLTIHKCEIEYFETIFEKLLTIIGIDTVISSRKFKVYVNSKKELFIDEKAKQSLLDSLTSTKRTLLNTGAVFEFVNTSIAIRILNGEMLNPTHILNDMRQYCDQSLGSAISPSNYLNLIDLILFYNLCSLDVSKFIFEFVDTVFSARTNEKLKALLLYKLEKMLSTPLVTHVNILFVDYSSDFNLQSRRELSDSINTIMKLSLVSKSKSISQTRGSVIEQVIVSYKDVIDSFWQLFMILSLLGFKFKKETKSGSILEFSLLPSNNWKKSLSRPSDKEKKEIADLLFNKGVDIAAIQEEKPISKDDESEIKRIRALLNNKEIGLTIRKAVAKELINSENITSSLLDQISE